MDQYLQQPRRVNGSRGSTCFAFLHESIPFRRLRFDPVHFGSHYWLPCSRCWTYQLGLRQDPRVVVLIEQCRLSRRFSFFRRLQFSWWKEATVSDAMLVHVFHFLRDLHLILLYHLKLHSHSGSVLKLLKVVHFHDLVASSWSLLSQVDAVESSRTKSAKDRPKLFKHLVVGYHLFLKDQSAHPSTHHLVSFWVPNSSSPSEHGS